MFVYKIDNISSQTKQSVTVKKKNVQVNVQFYKTQKKKKITRDNMEVWKRKKKNMFLKTCDIVLMIKR